MIKDVHHRYTFDNNNVMLKYSIEYLEYILMYKYTLMYATLFIAMRGMWCFLSGEQGILLTRF